MAVYPGYFRTTYASILVVRQTLFQRTRLALLLIALAVFPAVTSGRLLDIAITVTIAVPGAVALNLLTGMAGRVSLGNAAFMAIGAFTAQIVGVQCHCPFLVSVVAGGVSAAAISAIAGLSALRLRGLYLIMATLALHYLVLYAVEQYQLRYAGEAGFVMPTASIGSLELDSQVRWYYAFLVLAVTVVTAYTNILRSRSGRAWMAIRERDIAAEILGVRVNWYKLLAFLVSSFVIGIQGAVFAYYINVLSFGLFTLNLAIAYVAMIVIGGLGSRYGAIYGALFVSALPELVSEVGMVIPASGGWISEHLFDIQAGAYGLSIVLFLLFEPRGIAEMAARVRKYFALWPFSREGGRGEAW